MADQETLTGLLGQRVTVTRPAGWSTAYRTDTTWTGVLVAFGTEPDLHLKTPAGQICLPMSFTVEPAPEPSCDCPPRQVRDTCQGVTPGERLPNAPETCCVCGGGPVEYHNYRDQPFCWPCADCQCDQEPCVRRRYVIGEHAPDAVTIPRDALNDLVRIAAHVSMGRSAAGITEQYPDALARRTLGALADAGLLPVPEPQDKP